MLTDDRAALAILRAVGQGQERSFTGQRLLLRVSTPLTDAFHTMQPVVLESTAARAARYPDLSALQPNLGTEALVAVPLVTKGHAVGMLGMSFAEQRQFTAEDLAFINALAQQCAQALDRTCLYETEQQARAEAEEAVRIRDMFFSVAAHELRTPLTSLMGQAQLLRRRLLGRPATDERDQRATQVIVEQSERLNG